MSMRLGKKELYPMYGFEKDRPYEWDFHSHVRVKTDQLFMEYYEKTMSAFWTLQNTLEEMYEKNDETST